MSDHVVHTTLALRQTTRATAEMMECSRRWLFQTQQWLNAPEDYGAREDVSQLLVELDRVIGDYKRAHEIL